MRQITKEIEGERKEYKIIAVDDNQGMLDSLEVFTRKLGYSLVTCTDPYEAVAKVKKEHFDLMLLGRMYDLSVTYDDEFTYIKCILK